MMMMRRTKKADAVYPSYLNPNDRLLTVQEVAAILQLSVDAVYGLRDSGQLPKAVTIGRHVRWRLGDLRSKLGLPPIPWVPPS